MWLSLRDRWEHGPLPQFSDGYHDSLELRLKHVLHALRDTKVASPQELTQHCLRRMLQTLQDQITLL